MRYKDLTDEEFIEYGTWVKMSGKNGLNREEARKHAIEKLHTSPMRNSNEYAVREQYAELIASGYGVFSLTKALDHILLWSHYADKHRGFCVEFDGPALRTHFDKGFMEEPDERVIIGGSVIYKKDLPRLRPSRESFDQNSDLLLRCKSDVWEYEQEYRFLWCNHPDEPMYIDSECVSGIYLGCAMDDQTAKQISILSASQFPKAIVWRGIRSLDDFAVEFEKVS